jgi:hypothetical protein
MTYTLEQVRTEPLLDFTCETCGAEWQVSMEERERLLNYLEKR